jgi:hypothetical protein
MKTIEAKVRGIPFPSHDVAAFLDGRKTQWREVCNPQPKITDDAILFPWASFYHNGHVHTWDKNGVGGQNWNAPDFPDEDKFAVALQRTPHTKPSPHHPGDIVFVKEKHYPCQEFTGSEYKQGVIYWHDFSDDNRPDVKWISARSMKAELARIFLRVKSVRAERLQDMTFKDWVADFCPNGFLQEQALQTFVGKDNQVKMASGYWNTRHPKTPWNQNPYVFAYEAERCGREEII